MTDHDASADRTGLRAEFALTVGALDIEISLESTSGPIVLVGPNGAGKTSILLALLGILQPRRGSIFLAGRVLFDTASGVDVVPERRQLGYVPQNYGLFTHMTALANVEFALAAHAMPRRAERRDRARALLDELEVGFVADRRPAQLSGGEKQRVALARALAAEPKALLLDEPLAALDAGARRQVRSFLAARLTKLALPAVVVTHDPADAEALATELVVLEAGRVVQRGSFPDLRAAPLSPWIAEFARG